MEKQKLWLNVYNILDAKPSNIKITNVTFFLKDEPSSTIPCPCNGVALHTDKSQMIVVN